MNRPLNPDGSRSPPRTGDLRIARSVAPLTASGPLLPFAGVVFVVASARRARRCPAGAHAVAVGAGRRLHCGPCACRRKGVRQAHGSPQGLPCVRGALHRPGVASQNSLRSLRSLRSDNRDESVYEARCARRPQACASRRHRNRPHRAPPAALHRWGALRRTPRASLAKGVGWLTQRSRGGGPGAARAGGVRPDTSSPVDCLCLANARGSVPGHERSRPPDGLGPLQQSMRRTAMGRRQTSAPHRRIRHSGSGPARQAM